MPLLELLVTAKVLLVIKGALVASAHQGLGMHLLSNFVSTVWSAGLIPALEGLVGALGGIGAMAGLVVALEKVVKAIKDGELDKAIDALDGVLDAVNTIKKQINPS